MNLPRTPKTRQWPLHIGLVVVTLLTIYPILLVVGIALSPREGFKGVVSPIPEEVTFQNFLDVINASTDQGEWLFGPQLVNSLVVSVATTVVGIFLATTAAYAFSRARFPGRRLGLMAFLVSQMFPGVLMMIPLYGLLGDMGLLNESLGLILVYATTAIPFCVWMLKGYFDTIPRELEESAMMDGASQFTIFWRIILPLSLPAIAVTALFSFMTAWNEFVLAYTFTNEPTAYTLPVAVQGYVGKVDIDWPRFAAASVLVSVPVMALFFKLQKHLVGGLTAGSVKG